MGDGDWDWYGDGDGDGDCGWTLVLTPESRWANAADEPSAPPPPAEAETESTLEGTERTRVEVFERRVDERQDDAKRRFAGRDAEGFEPTGTVTETGTYRRGILRVDVDADGAPKNFLCPITQSLLEDPVIWVDGHTYERTAIARWDARATVATTSSAVDEKIRDLRHERGKYGVCTREPRDW